MKVHCPGHVYELANFEKPLEEGQTLQFIQKEQIDGVFKTVADGTTNEEVLAMLIDRLNSLNAKLPNRHTEMATGMCQVALELLNMRTAERKARNVEGTPKT